MNHHCTCVNSLSVTLLNLHQVSSSVLLAKRELNFVLPVDWIIPGYNKIKNKLV
jgi:hypothetical protein